MEHGRLFHELIPNGIGTLEHDLWHNHTKVACFGAHICKIMGIEGPILKLRIMSQGAQKVDPDVEVVLPIRCKPGKKLSPEEREINRLQSRIRVRVENAIRRIKTHRIMGDRYRNPLKKYDSINDIVCGLVNQSVLWRVAQAT